MRFLLYCLQRVTRGTTCLISGLAQSVLVHLDYLNMMKSVSFRKEVILTINFLR